MKLSSLSLLVAAAALAAGCGDDSPGTGPGDGARVRFVNIAPGAGAVDFYVDGNLVEQGTTYLGTSDYQDVVAGSRNIEVRLGGTTTIVDENVTLEDGETYSLFAAGITSQEELAFLVDDQTPPAAGNGKVRVVNGSPGVGRLDFFIVPSGTDITGLTPDYANVGFRQLSEYTELPTGVYEIVATIPGTHTVVIESPISVSSGSAQSAVAVDDSKGGEPFGMVVFNDMD